jgi:hypothetical protein
VGVSIHTPEHYVKNPLDWDFAVLRLKDPLLAKWENRNLLRRLLLGYLEAHYDLDLVRTGTLAYTAKAMDAKGRAVLSGLVKGAIGGVVVLSLTLLGVVATMLYYHGAEWWPHVQGGLQTAWALWNEMLVNEFVQERHADVVNAMFLFLKWVGFTIVGCVALYLLGNFAKILTNAWVGLTAMMGAIYGAVVVPAMAEFAAGWEDKSPAWRWGFTFIWFMPLIITAPVLNYLLFTSAGSFAGKGVEYIVKANIIIVLASAVMTVWLAGILTMIADPVITGIAKFVSGLGSLKQKLFTYLGWPIAPATSCRSYLLTEKFICSGLAQVALAEVARETRNSIDNVVVNDQWLKWKAEPQQTMLSRAEENCMLRDTFPKEFALSDKFEWTYLYIKGVLTVSPTPSAKAQAYSAPVTEKRGPLSQWAAFSTRLALTGAFLTIIVSVTNDQLTSDILQHVLGDGGVALRDHYRSGVLLLAGLLGVSGWLCARMAKRELAIDPTRRGHALRIYGWTVGLITVAVAALNFGAVTMGFVK